MMRYTPEQAEKLSEVRQSARDYALAIVRTAQSLVDTASNIYELAKVAEQDGSAEAHIDFLDKLREEIHSVIGDGLNIIRGTTKGGLDDFLTVIHNRALSDVEDGLESDIDAIDAFDAENACDEELFCWSALSDADRMAAWSSLSDVQQGAVLVARLLFGDAGTICVIENGARVFFGEESVDILNDDILAFGEVRVA